MRKTKERRFFDKIEKTDGCWLWTASITDKGYGQFWNGKKHQRAHRFSYELHKGPIPLGLHIDHLCRNRACVNPDHLEAVTGLENTRRGERVTKIHCIKGHELSGDNLISSARHRGCRACQKAYHKNYQKEHRQKLNIYLKNWRLKRLVA